MSKMKIEPQMESNIRAIFLYLTFEVPFEPANQGLPDRCIGASWNKLCRTLALRSKFGHISLEVQQLVTGTVNLKDNFVPYHLL